MHKAIQRYKAKTCLWQNTIMSIKLFGFSTFYVFLDFWHKSKKRLIKNNIKKFKANNKQTKHAIQIAYKVVCALQKNHDKEVKHTSHMRFKELYQHQWSYKVIQIMDHRESWWRYLPFDFLYVWIQDIQLYLPPNPWWSGNVSLCVLTSNVEQDS